MMKQNSKSIAGRNREDQHGQVLIMVALAMVALLGMVALAVDIGHVYVASQELQASANAAALAGAQALPNSTAAGLATAYSAVTGNANANSNLPNVTMPTGYPKVKCLTTLTGWNIPCVAPAAGNAIQVVEQASVPMSFARIFGLNSISLNATATAAMRGAAVGPYNVAIIIDTTGSMTSTDSDPNCNNQRINCALAGVRVLLNDLSPCQTSLSTCGTVTAGNVPNPLDEVSIFVFPGLSTAAQAAYDYDCSNSPVPTTSIYSLSPLPNYQIVPFSSDYRVSDTATTLNTTSDLVLASRGGPSTCLEGIDVVGNRGTFYAGVITAAQAALVTAQTNRPNSQNVMIILSDGDANATTANMSGYSTVNQCHQAVTAAQNAQGAGTRVYSVAYGSPATGCTTDTAPAITPCATMQQMASSALTFFSDYTATGGASSCVSTSRPTTSLNQIFTDIAGDLQDARLIPNNTN